MEFFAFNLNNSNMNSLLFFFIPYLTNSLVALGHTLGMVDEAPKENVCVREISNSLSGTKLLTTRSNPLDDSNMNSHSIISLQCSPSSFFFFTFNQHKIH